MRQALVFLSLIAWTFIAHAEDPASRSRAAQDYLSVHESELQSTQTLMDRYVSLRNLAPAALEAGERQKAADYALALLDAGQEQATMPGFGPGFLSDATHIANTVLGRIALFNDDIETAKRHLLLSAKVTGSPVLSSFGPNMRLARDLLERGEFDVVLQYFESCAKFWRMSEPQLSAWTALVKRGEVPDFGANILYGLNYWNHSR